MNNNYYFGEPDDSYDSVLNNLTQTDVHNCETSSIPLADFWHPRNSQGIKHLIDLLNIGFDINAFQKCFEYPVFAEKNEHQIGKPSRTDLMLLNDKYNIAIEAKYRENFYGTIEEWKKEIKKYSVKLDVLSSWYEYIKPYSCFDSKEIQKIEQVVDYQFLHRVASACYKCPDRGKSPIVVYQLFFNKHDKESEYHQREIAGALRSFSQQYLKFNEKILFYIVFTPLVNVEEVRTKYKKIDSDIFLKMKENYIYRFGKSFLFN